MRMCLVAGIIILLVIIIVPVVITYVWPFEFHATIDESSTRSNCRKQSKVIPSNNSWGGEKRYGLQDGRIGGKEGTKETLVNFP